MSKTAFIFPGQGAQIAGMGKDFYHNSSSARKIFDMASDTLEMDMPVLCFEDNDRLDITEYTQAALVTTSLAMAQVVKEKGVFPDLTAGLSLGEYCAIVAAGGMSCEDAVAVARKRGILMQNAVPAGIGSMAAVIGMEADKIEEVLAGIEGVSIANYNCPGQIVITGLVKSVEQAGGELKEAGAKRVLPLNVSGPFHSPLLEEAGDKLAAVLAPIQLEALKIPYVTNVTGEFVTKSDEIKALLARQVASSVRWQQSVEAMIAEGTNIFIEIGPGKSLSGFVKKIDRNVKIYNIATWEDMERVTGELTC